MRLLACFAFCLCLLAPAREAVAQAPDAQMPDAQMPDAPGTWRLYTSMRNVQAVAREGTALWAGTQGGLFRYDTATGEIERYTTAEGLANLSVRALALDATRGTLWIGYDDGVLDRLDTASGAVTSFFDIARADRFPQRGVRRIRVRGDSLLVATAFGVVVFDAARGEVRDTYERFGGLEAGTAANDVLVAPLPDGRAGLWVGTDRGVVSAPLASPNLRVPANWTVLPGSPAPALSLGMLSGQLYAGRASRAGQSGDLWRRSPDGTWEQLGFANESVPDLVPYGDRLAAVSSFFVGVFSADGTRSSGVVLDVGSLHAIIPDAEGRLWVGTAFEGLARLASFYGPFATIPTEATATPDGPLLNTITALDVGPEGEVWVGYIPQDVLNGLSRLREGSWRHYSTRTGFPVAMGGVFEVHVDRRGWVWAGVDGDGLMRITPEEEITVFGEENSTLRAEQGFPGYIVVLGIDEDADGRIWVTNRNAPQPLHVWEEGAGWASMPRPPGIPQGAARYGRLHIDRFGQKWVSLFQTLSTPGAGFAVIQTGDPRNPQDDEAVAVTGPGDGALGTGLPNPNVNAFAEDLDGRMWIGTGRGIASVASPGSVFANPALAEPRWARTPDEGAFFLRDLAVFDVAVDPAGRKWLGSADGAWLLNAEGNAVVAHFTAENSPLPPGAVTRVVVNGADGTVYFATSGGVASYRGDSVAPAARRGALRVYPNPFRPGEDAAVRFEGLVAETRVRILTADGQTVAAFDARGGSATWDGRDQRTGQLVPSGVYLVAASGGGGAAYGKIAVIR